MKRFYEKVSAEAAEAGDGGFAIMLDDKTAKTAGGAPLVTACQALAEAIAEEWQGQGEDLDAETMPLTRIAGIAIDGIEGQPEPVIEELLGYGASDLLCYRAEDPTDLIQRQQKAWEPYLDWIEARFSVRPNVTTGIAHIDQPAEMSVAYGKMLAEFDACRLAALAIVVRSSGSLILALALLDGHASAEDVWTASRIDEVWQIEQWGRDEDAEEKARADKAHLLAAARALDLLRA